MFSLKFLRFIFTTFTFTAYYLGLGLSPLQSQPPIIANKEYHIHHYTDENGLPQNSVKKIAQDDAGFIWLGTDGGLSRFDGQAFKNFNDVNSIRGIHSFDPGLGKEAGVIYGISDKFERIKISEGQASETQGPIDTDERFFGQDYHSTLAQYLTRGLPDQAEGRLEPDNIVIPSPPYQTIVCSPNQVTIHNRSGIIRSFSFRNQNRWRFFRLHQNLYYLASNGRLSKFDAKRKEVQSIKIKGLPPWSAELPLIYWNNTNNQVFIYLDDTLYRITESKEELYAEKILSGFSLVQYQIKTVFYDAPSQRLFLGSLSDGLFVVLKKRFEVVANQDPLSDNVYYGQVLLNDSTIVTAQGEYFSLLADRTIVHDQKPLLKENYDIDKYLLIADDHGNKWTKSNKTIFKYDANFDRLSARIRLKDDITWLRQGRGNRLWVGLLHAGLYALPMDSTVLQPIKFIGAPLTNISWIEEVSDTLLWVGTDHGLYQVHTKTKETKKIKQLDGLFIRSLYIPHPNEMWITTHRHGIYLIKDHKLTKFPLDHNRFLARSHCMVEDSAGFMWINTNNGLFQFRKNALLKYLNDKTPPYYRYYNRAHGFKLNEFNGGCQPCAIQMPNGTISFPSMAGLIWFDPKNFYNSTKPTPLIIDKVVVDSQEAQISGDKIELKPNFNQLTIQLSRAFYGEPGDQRLYYSINPSNQIINKWHRLQSNNLNINIYYLNPGHYTLSIKGTDGFDNTNIFKKDIKIYVSKNWYQTWWAIGLLTIAFIGLVLLIIHLRLRHALNQNELLERKIKERTATLQRTVLDLKDSQSELLKQNKLHTYIIASISHDFRSPLKFMHTWLTGIPDEVKNGQADSVSDSSQLIEKTMRHIMRLTDDMTHYLRAITKESQGSWNLVSLKPLVEDKTTLFKSLSWINKGTIKIAIDPEIKIKTNANLLGIVIHNLIDNAFKSKPTGHVTITTCWKPHSPQPLLELTVRDNGPGIPEELLLWLNSSPKDHIAPPQSYQGLGLAMIKSTCETLGVTLLFQNINGTMVTLTFPPEGPHKH